MVGNILLTALFIFANAICVAAEFAIVKVRQSQLRVRANGGSKLAKYGEDIVHHLDSYLSATQVGVTLASLGLGWIGEPVVGEIIRSILDAVNFDISTELVHQIALPAAFVLMSFLHIVFGELAPKSLAILYPEDITLALSIPLKMLHFIFKPFIFVLNGTANLVLRIFGLEPPNESDTQHSSDEIRIILEESSKSGVIEDSEHILIENIFDFAETPVKQIMVPRNNIDAVEMRASINEIWETIIERGYSRIPVYDTEIDNIVGIIYGKDMLALIKNPNLIILEDILRKPLFVNEDDKIDDVLRKMQKTHIQLAIVYNEFGGTAGLLTIEDILEEIVGEIQDEHDDEQELVGASKDGAMEIASSIPINDINDLLPYPLPESENYETLGGYLLNTLGRIPQVNEVLAIDNYIFTILEANERKIERIRIEQCPIITEEDNN
ncbi:MAG: hemolysin family protein [Ignavibacteria bacterium]|jgi:CBS domain containing-hemolysin-like protein|nr:hemolysin family protein [Ignavibacteria bacterium]